MKKTLIILGLSLGFILPSQSFAIQYVQSKGGSIVKIDAAAFQACADILYRNSAKDELATDQKRALVNAMLKGSAVNDLAAAIDTLKKTAGMCSYGTDSEKFE